MNKKTNKKGFTLIEILVVIGIIAILAAVVLVAINPARQFAQARDSQRVSNLNTILNAIGQNIADNKGIFNCGTVVLPVTLSEIGTDGIDLTCLVPTYIATSLPFDPAKGNAANTRYQVSQDALGRVTISTMEMESSIPRITALSITR